MKATKFDEISISINPGGCPPLATTSLGQAVCYDLQYVIEIGHNMTYIQGLLLAV